MKNLKVFGTTLLLCLAFLSCTPEAISDEAKLQSCCGENEEIPPIQVIGENNV